MSSRRRVSFFLSFLLSAFFFKHAGILLCMSSSSPSSPVALQKPRILIAAQNDQGQSRTLVTITNDMQPQSVVKIPKSTAQLHAACENPVSDVTVSTNTRESSLGSCYFVVGHTNDVLDSCYAVSLFPCDPKIAEDVLHSSTSNPVVNITLIDDDIKSAKLNVQLYVFFRSPGRLEGPRSSSSPFPGASPPQGIDGLQKNVPGSLSPPAQPSFLRKYWWVIVGSVLLFYALPSQPDPTRLASRRER